MPGRQMGRVTAATAVALAVLAGACVPAAPARDPLASSGAAAVGSPVEAVGRRVTVRVRNRTCEGLGTGSGVVVGEQLLVTNRHVVEGADRLQVSTVDGRSFEVEVAAAAVDTDLALVEVDGPLPDPVDPAPADPQPGDGVTAVGFPGGERLTFSRGEVQGYATDPLHGRDEVLVVSARVRPGSSGGPLLDQDGRLVGVIYALRAADGAGLALPVSRLRGAGDDAYQPVEPCGATRRSLDEQAGDLGLGEAVPPRPPRPLPACPTGQPEVDGLRAVVRPDPDGTWHVTISGEVVNRASEPVVEPRVEVEVAAPGGAPSAVAAGVAGTLPPGGREAFTATVTVTGPSPPTAGPSRLRWTWADPALHDRC